MSCSAHRYPEEVSCSCCERFGDSHARLLRLRSAFDPPFVLQFAYSLSWGWRHVCNSFLFGCEQLWLNLGGCEEVKEISGSLLSYGILRILKKTAEWFGLLEQVCFDLSSFVCPKSSIRNGVGAGELWGSCWLCDMGNHTCGYCRGHRTDLMLSPTWVPALSGSWQV